MKYFSVIILGVFCALAGSILAQTNSAETDSCLQKLNDQTIDFGETAPGFDGLPLTQWSVKSVSTMRQCLSSIPFDLNDALGTLETIQKYLELYPFLEMNRNSGPPYNLSVNTDYELNVLANAASTRTFRSMYDFHVAVRETVRSARDGHFHYALPHGFGMNFVLQPLGLIAEADNNSALRFFVSADYSLGVHDYFFGTSPPLSVYVGKEVLSIDGIHPLDYLTSLARKYPMSKDDSVSFNFWFFHAFVYRGVILPDKDTIQFTLGPSKDGTKPDLVNATVNYVVLDSVRSVSQRRTQNANSQGTTVQCSSSQQRADASSSPIHPNLTISARQKEHNERNNGEWHTNAPLHDHFRQRLFVQQLLTHANPASNSRQKRSIQSDSESPLRVLMGSDSAGYTVSALRQTNLVVKLTSFMPVSNTDSGFWGQPLNWVLQNAQNYDRIIIDISDNVGGLVCLGHIFASILNNDADVYDYHDVRQTELFAQFLPQMAVEMNGSTVYLASVYDDGENRLIQRGGTNANYSQPFEMYCDDVKQMLSYTPPSTPIPKEKLVLVSNGVSVSTATVFAKEMDALGVKTVTYGGLPYQRPSISFSIGNPVVVDSSSLNSIFACSEPSTANSFPQFPNSAQLGFPFAEAYEFRDSVIEKRPMSEWRVAEFVRNLATEHVAIWNADQDAMIAVYDAAIALAQRP